MSATHEKTFEAQYRDYLVAKATDPDTEIGTVVSYEDWLDERLFEQLLELCKFHKVTKDELHTVVVEQKAKEATELKQYGVRNQLRYLLKDLSYHQIEAEIMAMSRSP